MAKKKNHGQQTNIRADMNRGLNARQKRVEALRFAYEAKTKVQTQQTLDLIDSLEKERVAKHPPKPKPKANAHLDFIDQMEKGTKKRVEVQQRARKNARSAIDWINSVEGQKEATKKPQPSHLDLIDELENPKPKPIRNAKGQTFEDFQKVYKPQSMATPPSPLEMLKDQTRIDTNKATGDYYGSTFKEKPDINLNVKIELKPKEERTIGLLERVGIIVDPESIKGSSLKNKFKNPDSELGKLEQLFNKDPNAVHNVLAKLNASGVDWSFGSSNPNKPMDDLGADSTDPRYQNVSFAEMASKGFAPKWARSVFDDLWGQRAEGKETVSNEVAVSILKNRSDELHQRQKEQFERNVEDEKRGFTVETPVADPELATYYDDSMMEKFKEFITIDENKDNQRAELMARISEKEWGQISQTIAMRTILYREVLSATDVELNLLYKSYKSKANDAFLGYAYFYGSTGDGIHNGAQKDDLVIVSEIKGKDVTITKSWRPPSRTGRSRASVRKN